MNESSFSNADAPSDLPDADFSEVPMNLEPPPEASYPDKASLLASVQAHGKAHGYNVVVKSSSTPTEKKPGRTAKIWLRCDRGGSYRPRNGLTEETRKRKRTSRLMDCPFMLVAAGTPGIWSLTVLHPEHNHGPVIQTPRHPPHHKVKRGQLQANPYYWPHDASLTPFTTALLLIDMQRDFCEPGGYLQNQGYDITPVRTLIPGLQRLLYTFRNASFPVYHTREGHRPDLSTLSSRESFRSRNNASGLGIGSEGPLGRLLIRGEPGHDIIPELYPIDGEPVIDKPGRGAFAHTDFELLLRIKGIRNLIVAGVTTDVCVSTTIREAIDRGFDCCLVEDGTAASDVSLAAATCDSVRMEGGIFGATTLLEEVVRTIENFKAVTVKKKGQSAESVEDEGE